MNESKIVHAYCRASSVDRQTTEQQRMAIELAYPSETSFVWYEEQVSGWKGSRSEYDALKDSIIKGRAKEIVCCNIARLGRNQREALAMLDLCQERGVKIWFLDQQIDFSGPLGKALFALFAAFAQMDSDSKSQNIKRKFAMKRAKEPDWKMHGNVKDTVSEKVKKRAPEVYRMLDAGSEQVYISEMLDLCEGTITKLKRLRSEGKELLTRKEYAQRYPGWHKVKIEERPELPDVASA